MRSSTYVIKDVPLLFVLDMSQFFRLSEKTWEKMICVYNNKSTTWVINERKILLCVSLV